MFTATLKLAEPSRITALNAVATEFTYNVAVYGILDANSLILNANVFARHFMPTTIVFLNAFVDEFPNPIYSL